MRTATPFPRTARPKSKIKLVGMLGAAALAVCAASAASAAITIDFQEIGSTVVATTSGSLDLTGLTLQPDQYYLQDGAAGSIAYVGTGAGGHRFDTDPYTILNAYSGLTGPTSFGPGSFTYADTGAGDAFGLNASSFSSTYVFVPIGYVSGAALSSSATFLGQSIASLGLTAGSYVFSSGTDSVTVNIAAGASAAPETATWAMMLVGFGALGGSMRYRRHSKTIAHA